MSFTDEMNETSAIPRVSVIVPAFNSAATIGICLEAVLASDYPAMEVIVVDDGSTDDTAAIAARFTGVTLLRKVNGGSASAKNHGAAHAGGDYLYFLDSDVLIFTDTIALLVRTALDYRVDWVVGRYSTVPANNGFIHHYKAVADYVLYIPREQRHSVALDCQIGGGGELISSRAFRQLHGFNESYRGASVEREELLVRFQRAGFHSAANPMVRTRHFFPDFATLVKNYVFRIHETMKLLSSNKVRFSYISAEKAIAAPAVTSLFLLLLGMQLCTVAIPAAVTATVFVMACWLHREMLVEGIRRKGALMGLEMFALHLFMSVVIFLSGVTSYLRIRFGSKPADSSGISG